MLRTFLSGVLLLFVLLAVAREAEAQCPAGQQQTIGVVSIGGYNGTSGGQQLHYCPPVADLQLQIFAMKGYGPAHADAYSDIAAQINATDYVRFPDNSCSIYDYKAQCSSTWLGTTDSCNVSLIYRNMTTGPGYSAFGMELTGPGGACTSQYAGAFRPDGPNLGPCKTCPKVGNPINPANGNKFQQESDYTGTGAFPLSFSRYYNSQDLRTGDMGLGWRHSYSKRIRTLTAALPGDGSTQNTSALSTQQEACVTGWSQLKSQAIGLAQTTASYSGGVCSLKEGSITRGTMAIHATSPGGTLSTLAIYAERENGSTERFAVSGSTYTAPTDATARLEQNGAGYRYTDNDVVEEYNSSGVLLSIKHRSSGVTQTLAYDPQNPNRLASVTDSFGRTLLFGYTDGRLTTLTDPAGNQYVYTYDQTTNDLKTVAAPGAQARQYHYGYGSFPRVLTGITDENGDLFASWTYDTMGRAISSQHAGGAERVDLTFGNTSTEVEDALEVVWKQTFQKVNSSGSYRTSAVERTCPTCTAASTTTTLDSNGFVASRTDYNGNETRYVFNSRGLEESRTEAYGTLLARTITTQWHDDYRVPKQIDEPGRSTVYTFWFDGAFDTGLRHTETVTDTTTGEARITTWTYVKLGTSPNFFYRVETIDGPRTDVTDVTTFSYFSDSNQNHKLGDLHTITNAEGHVTEITAYDAHGNPLTIKDPNVVTTDLTYNMRQRLKTRTAASGTAASATTTFDYDDAGQLTKVTLPDGSFLSYAYDAAHRLTDIEDKTGNKIHYTLDLMGNRMQEDVKDASGDMRRKQQQVFDALSQLKQIKDANSNVVTQFGYDAQGNRTSQTDAGLFDTTYVPDALNRIKEVLDAADGTTLYSYNSLDQFTQVTDPEGLQTSYTINALGDMTKQVSPDTDETNYTFDAAGNRISQTDKRGVAVNYTFDKLNRLTLVDYDGTTEDVVYSYDSTAGGNYGIGRLTSIQDQGGATSLKYDARGNLVEEQRVTGSGTYTTSYAFDAADRVATITYPSQRVVSYERNPNGQVTKVTSTVGTVTTDIATEIEYLPFGGIRGYKLGNNVEVTRAHDQDYRITEIKDQGTAPAPVQHLDLDYDLRSNITSRADRVDSVTETLGFDALSRLTSSTGGAYGTQGFTYDGVGNRLTQTGAAPQTYSYTPDTHRLATAGSTSFTHDAAGNITGMGALTLTYNLAHRLAGVSGGAVAVTSAYNAAGQRVKKTAGGVETLFFYDRQGHLLAEEFSGDQRVRREYVWLADIPLALESTRTIAEVIVDNTDSGFSSVGAWTSATAVDQYGASYAKRGPAVEVPGQTVVDDVDVAATYTGVWLAQTYQAYHGAECEPSPKGNECLDSQIRELYSAFEAAGIGSADSGDSASFHRSVGSDPATGAPPVFTWQATLPAAGRYRVYAVWASTNDSGPATYTITHADGSATLVVDQSTSSGGWYSLGSFEFNAQAVVNLAPSVGHAAIADAIRVVPIETTDSDFARWVALGEAGEYEVLGRWPSVAGAADAAPFSITHASGTSTFTKDQSANAGQWGLFGSFTFNDPATQGVRLGAAWDQTVLADAIHFKPVAAQAERRHVAFFHVDHLNTPQKMTDAAQDVVWEASYEPFGKASITAQPHFDSPLRFPGQYFDSETGLHQNWFREYDPSIGRYLQSDPIGLAGGINTYLYVNASPTGLTDPMGLESPTVTQMGGPPSDPAMQMLSETYREMKDKNVKGTDRFFHCLAACRAAQVEPNKQRIADMLADKETLDYALGVGGIYGDNTEVPFTRDQYRKNSAYMRDDVARDHAANQKGLRCPTGTPCEKHCSPLLDKLPKRYRPYMAKYRTKW